MNNNEFDNIIKESLEGFSVPPSPTIGKSLGRKMVVKNLWFFHKTKVLLTILIASVSSITYFNTTSTNQELSNVSNIAQGDLTIKKDQLKDLDKVNKSNSTSQKSTPDNKTTEIVQNSNKETSTPSKNKFQAKSIKSLKLKKNKKESLRPHKSNSKPSPTVPIKEEQIIALNEFNEAEESNKNDFKNYKINAFPIENSIENDIVNFEQLANNDYVNPKKGIISFDAFFTPYNQTITKNKVDDQYSENWWDFYRETGYINSKIEGGIRVNYDWKNIIASTGINYNRVIEYKPTYLYESNSNEYVLTVLGLSEISGVQVNGVDSAHYIFYTQKDEELIDKLENEEYNTYSYLSIPLRLGYELETPKFSIIMQAGINYNKLIGAKGTYLRRYTNSETLDIYYNKGIETALLTRKNSMLKKSNFSFLASVAGNIRVSPTFDLFGEFTCEKSQNSITQNEYFLQKNTTNFGTNFGVKYYLEPRIKKPTVLQEVF